MKDVHTKVRESDGLYYIEYRYSILNKWGNLYYKIIKEPFDIVSITFKTFDEADVYRKTLTRNKIELMLKVANEEFNKENKLKQTN